MQSSPAEPAGAVAAADGDWVGAFFRDADKVEIDALTAWFSDDIELRFANSPVICGKATATAVMGEFYSTIAGMRHERINLLCDGPVAAQQAIVTYTTMAGRTVPLPVSSYLRRTAAGTLDRLWIYIDIAPLYASASGV